MGTRTLVKADLGTKRACPSCGARFYDLTKRPIECPKCGFSFEPEALYKQRRTRQPEAVAETTGKSVDADDEDSDDDDDEEAEEAEVETIVEPVEGEAPIQVGSDDEDADEEETAAPEVEADEAGMQVVEGDEALEDLGTEDVEENEDDDTLLETVEEDEDDVSDIIDADIEKDER